MPKVNMWLKHMGEKAQFTQKTSMDHAHGFDLEDPPPKNVSIQNSRSVFRLCVAPGILIIFLGEVACSHLE